MSDKISTARDAATTFLNAGNPEDDYFLVTFSQRAQLTQDDFSGGYSLDTVGISPGLSEALTSISPT